MWWASVVGAAVIVIGVAGVGTAVQVQYAGLTYGEPYRLPATSGEDLVVPAIAPGGDTPADPALPAVLDALATQHSGELGSFGARVTDVSSGEVIWSRSPGTALRPASSTKVLTAAAAILSLGPDDRLETQVIQGAEPGTVIIRAVGDVGLTKDNIAELAGQLKDSGKDIQKVLVDTSAWPGETLLPGWEDADIDAGFIAPMEPVMLYGGRIGATTGDVPRTHTPAKDVAAALAQAVGASQSGVAKSADLAGEKEPEVLARTQSATLVQRLYTMMVHSDNVMAEAIGREIAHAHGQAPTAEGATTATLEILTRHGFDTTGVSLHDNSGLSTNNRITPQLLDAVLARAATERDLRDVLTVLPVAGGEGTLENRYSAEAGRGFVRAKTGTLTETSALAGTVTGQNNHIYTFAFMSNGTEVTEQRAALDTLASALRDAGSSDGAARTSAGAAAE